jgi:hypothetical protein
MPSQSHDRTAQTNRIYMLTNAADYNTLLQSGQTWIFGRRVTYQPKTNP